MRPQGQGHKVKVIDIKDEIAEVITQLLYIVGYFPDYFLLPYYTL